MTWVIHPKSQYPKGESYNGPEWEAADIRYCYLPLYEDRNEAAIYAWLLSKHSGRKFIVSPRREK